MQLYQKEKNKTQTKEGKNTRATILLKVTIRLLCKIFYLTTLALSEKLRYNVNEKKYPVNEINKTGGKGKYSNRFRATEDDKQNILTT